MDKEDMKKIMPHREPMLLMDDIKFDNTTSEAIGIVKIRGDEYFLQGHYPDNPIVPGVILCEMAAQTCILLFSDKIAGKLPVFAGMNNVRFRAIVRPDDIITFKCTVDKIREPFYFAKCKGYVDEKLCMSGEFSFASV